MATGSISVFSNGIYDYESGYPIRAMYSGAGITPGTWMCGWEKANKEYHIRAVHINELHKKLNSSLPLIKYKDVTIGVQDGSTKKITLDGNGYLNVSSYRPDPPDANYKFYRAGITYWSSISTKTAIYLLELGDWILGSPSAVITNLRVRYYYILNDAAVDIPE